MFRDEVPAFYADKIGPLSLNDELLASGPMAKYILRRPELRLHWIENGRLEALPHSRPEALRYQAGAACTQPVPAAVAQCLRPAGFPCIPSRGLLSNWSLHYLPGGATGNGQITARLDDNVQTMDLKPGHKQSGAAFDRFGFFNMQSGGWHVQLYVDDLSYTKSRAAR